VLATLIACPANQPCHLVELRASYGRQPVSRKAAPEFKRTCTGVSKLRRANTAAPNEMQFNGVGGLRTHISCRRIRAHTKERRRQMIKMKALSALLILTAAVATPAFAKEHGRAYDRYRGAYDQLNGPSFAIPQSQEGRNIENFGFSGRDPSRVGGEDPSLNPSGS
jgi:hypothetical protein